MKHNGPADYSPTPYIPELRAERGAVTVPCPTKEQKAAEDAQVRLLEAALNRFRNDAFSPASN